jgi:translation initiation factor IF-3
LFITKISIRINEYIIAREIRVVDDNGDMLGVMSPMQAISIARQRSLDLVEISPNAEPPVCKIMDYGKYKYEQQKKSHDARKKQKVVELKEIKVRPNIATGDYEVKLKHVIKFINAGDKVKIFLMFKGREITHNEVGFAVMHRFQNDTEEIAKAEYGPKLEGRNISMILVPK